MVVRQLIAMLERALVRGEACTRSHAVMRSMPCNDGMDRVRAWRRSSNDGPGSIDRSRPYARTSQGHTACMYSSIEEQKRMRGRRKGSDDGGMERARGEKKLDAHIITCMRVCVCYQKRGKSVPQVSLYFYIYPSIHPCVLCGPLRFTKRHRRRRPYSVRPLHVGPKQQ